MSGRRAVAGCAFAAGLLFPSVSAARTIGIGLGVDVPGLALASDLGLDRDPFNLALSVPVVVGGWRLEPQLAFSPTGGGDGRPGGAMCDESLTGSCELVEVRERRRVAVALGAGPVWPFGADLRAWAGPWAAVTIRSVSSAEDVEHDLSFGVGVGGEWFLDPAVSIGADLRPAFTSVELGNRALNRSESRDGWSFAVDALAALRMYLDRVCCSG